MAIFGSSFFTALNDGLTLAIISFLRPLVFQVASVIALPLVWEVDGGWAAVVVAELMAFIAFNFKEKEISILNNTQGSLFSYRNRHFVRKKALCFC